MNMVMINLTIGILIFMMANVTLGSVNSFFDGSFNKVKFFTGIWKALIILVVYIAVYFAGTLNPNVIVMEIDGVSANVTTAIYIVGMTGFVLYAKQIIEKLKVLLTPKTK